MANFLLWKSKVGQYNVKTHYGNAHSGTVVNI